MRSIILLFLPLVLAALPVMAETGISDSAIFTLDTTAIVSAGEEPVVPAAQGLGVCFPNPFNPSITIPYHLNHSAKVSLAIYDLKGRRVLTLVNGERQEMGPYQVAWNGRDQSGRTASGGVYLCRLKIDENVYHQRMTLIK
jgi:hypothetical protein